MRFLIGIALLALAGGGVASAQEFTVEVEGKSYEASDGKPLTLTTARGEKLMLTVRKKSVLHFTNGGVTFDYPSAMTVSTESLDAAFSITLESAKSPLVIIQVYKVPTTADDVRDTLIKSLRAEFLSRKASVEPGEKTITRPIHGVAREGRRLSFKLAGESQQADVYAFEVKKKVVALVLQHDLDDAELAKTYFPVVTNSLAAP
jgi:hypothetical protein